MSELHIDWTVCRGRGLCTELLDGVLQRDEWGFPRAIGYGSDVPIPRESELDAADAVAMCPLQALRLTEQHSSRKHAIGSPSS